MGRRGELEISDLIRVIGEKTGESGKTRKEELLERIWEKALEGDRACVQFILSNYPRGERGSRDVVRQFVLWLVGNRENLDEALAEIRTLADELGLRQR